MRRFPLLFVCLASFAFAAEPAQAPAAQSASQAELDACAQHIQARNRCLEDFCQMESELTVQKVRELVPDAPEVKFYKVKNSCMASMLRQNESDASRRAICERVAKSGHLAEMLASTRTCDAKKSCKEQVACLRPGVESHLVKVLKSHSRESPAHRNAK